MTWCEEFVSAYRRTPADRLSAYYDDRLSVFVETAGGPFGWTRPTVGAANVVNRLTELNLIGDNWPVETCQRTRPGDGLLVVVSDGRARRQILIVHQSTAAAAVVSVHFYYDGNTTTATDDEDDDDDDAASFQARFERWAASLDRTELDKYRTACRAGLTVARRYYAPPSGDRGARWRQYDRSACRFSCTRDGGGGGRVYTGVRPVRKRYARMAFDYGRARLRTVETCWYSVAATGDGGAPASDNAVVLAAGTVPGDRQFVQFFVIDASTRKILNDVLCLQLRRQHQRYADDRLSALSFFTSSSSSSSHPPTSSSLTTTFRSSCTEDDDDNWKNGTDNHHYHDDDDDDDQSSPIVIRTRLAATNLLAARRAMAATATKTTNEQKHQQSNNGGKLNPRQLFIGCVPLHVKYGQLKLLFERFGEVTYVKVYEGYNKQTGAKMLHNYAFLFFKDEVSVERAIAASPVPLDSNWNLNVSRPHHHATTNNNITTTAAAKTR